MTFLFGLLVLGASFGIYFLTLSPTISAGDSTEMVNAALVLGIPHQPSYPLNTILGHLFSLLPFGPNPVWRVNLMVAVFESLTILLIYYIILRLYLLFGAKLGAGTRFLALSASLFLAFSATFWQYGTRAEVFALNNFLVSLTILTTLIFLERKKMRWLCLTAFFSGLALTHHQTAILVGPPLLFLIWSSRREVLGRRDFWLGGFFFGFLGSLLYYFILTWLAKGDPPLNWGNPVDLTGVLRALRRADYGTFQAFLPGFREIPLVTPVDQVVFYLKSLISDFTLVGLILAAIGGLYTFGSSKKIFWFLSLGFGAGVFFLAYANFPIGDSFHQATAKRFQLLPDLFLSLFIAFGCLALWQKFLDLKLDFREKINLFCGMVVFLVLTLVFVIPLVANFSKANNKNNFMTMRYALDLYLPTEPNAIIMLSGDPSVFAANFVKTVFSSDQRIVFSPGQFHLPWFIPQLKSRYPDLIIPPPESGKQFTTTTQVIKANLDRRPIYISPELALYDPEVEKEFVLWPQNLLLKVRQKRGEEKLEAYREESQRLWESLDLSLFSWVRKNKPLMEDLIVGYYARHFHNLGYMFESVKLYEDAIREYKRAVEIDPYMADSLKALGVVYGTKLEPRDYRKGIDYLGKFISVADRSREEEIEAARYTIYKILEEEAAEATKSARFTSPEATGSAQVGTPSAQATPSGDKK